MDSNSTHLSTASAVGPLTAIATMLPNVTGDQYQSSGHHAANDNQGQPGGGYLFATYARRHSPFGAHNLSSSASDLARSLALAQHHPRDQLEPHPPNQSGGGGTATSLFETAILQTTSKFGLFDLCLVAVLISLILISIVGNCLVCVAIFTDRRLRKLGNAFIVSLAIADLFVSCLVMTFALCNDLMNYWLFGDWFCDVWISFDIMCCTASILNLCAISLDRFIHIKDCLFYNQWMTRRVAVSAVIVIWIISGLVSFVPINLGWHKPEHHFGRSPISSIPVNQLATIDNFTTAAAAAVAAQTKPISAGNNDDDEDPANSIRLNQLEQEPDAERAPSVVGNHAEAATAPPLHWRRAAANNKIASGRTRRRRRRKRAAGIDLNDGTKLDYSGGGVSSAAQAAEFSRGKNDVRNSRTISESGDEQEEHEQEDEVAAAAAVPIEKQLPPESIEASERRQSVLHIPDNQNEEPDLMHKDNKATRDDRKRGAATPNHGPLGGGAGGPASRWANNKLVVPPSGQKTLPPLGVVVAVGPPEKRRGNLSGLVGKTRPQQTSAAGHQANNRQQQQQHDNGQSAAQFVASERSLARKKMMNISNRRDELADPLVIPVGEFNPSPPSSPSSQQRQIGPNKAQVGGDARQLLFDANADDGRRRGRVVSRARRQLNKEEAEGEAAWEEVGGNSRPRPLESTGSNLNEQQQPPSSSSGNNNQQQQQPQLPQCMLTLTPTYAVVSSTISFYIPCIIMLGLYSKLFACARRHVKNIRATSKAPPPINSAREQQPDASKSPTCVLHKRRLNFLGMNRSKQLQQQQLQRTAIETDEPKTNNDDEEDDEEAGQQSSFSCTTTFHPTGASGCGSTSGATSGASAQHQQVALGQLALDRLANNLNTNSGGGGGDIDDKKQRNAPTNQAAPRQTRQRQRLWFVGGGKQRRRQQQKQSGGDNGELLKTARTWIKFGASTNKKSNQSRVDVGGIEANNSGGSKEGRDDEREMVATPMLKVNNSNGANDKTGGVEQTLVGKQQKAPLLNSLEANSKIVSCDAVNMQTTIPLANATTNLSTNLNAQLISDANSAPLIDADDEEIEEVIRRLDEQQRQQLESRAPIGLDKSDAERDTNLAASWRSDEPLLRRSILTDPGRAVEAAAAPASQRANDKQNSIHTDLPANDPRIARQQQQLGADSATLQPGQATSSSSSPQSRSNKSITFKLNLGGTKISNKLNNNHKSGLWLSKGKKQSSANSTCNSGPPTATATTTSRPLSSQSVEKQHSQLATHKAAVTLGIIMGTFLFCWVPFFCLNIIKAFCVDCIPSSMFRFFTWLGYANSALNPIIYGIHNSEFRNAFNRIFFKHLSIKNGRQYLNRRFSYDLRQPSASHRHHHHNHHRHNHHLQQQQQQPLVGRPNEPQQQQQQENSLARTAELIVAKATVTADNLAATAAIPPTELFPKPNENAAPTSLTKTDAG